MDILDDVFRLKHPKVLFFLPKLIFCVGTMIRSLWISLVFLTNIYNSILVIINYKEQQYLSSRKIKSSVIFLIVVTKSLEMAAWLHPGVSHIYTCKIYLKSLKRLSAICSPNLSCLHMWLVMYHKRSVLLSRIYLLNKASQVPSSNLWNHGLLVYVYCEVSNMKSKTKLFYFITKAYDIYEWLLSVRVLVALLFPSKFNFNAFLDWFLVYSASNKVVTVYFVATQVLTP